MGNYENLKRDYLGELNTLEEQMKNKATQLRKQGANDEAILENIKYNVVDIFYKVFNVSFEQVTKKSTEEENDEEKLSKLYESYLSFFQKLPAPWKIKMEKDKQHNMMEEYYKEKIKIETAAEIKDMFLKNYERYVV